MRRVFLLILLLAGCNGNPKVEYQRFILPEDRKDAQAWVSNCIKDANPQSDEEPEDWIRQCRRAAEELFGTYVPGYRQGEHWSTWVPFSATGPVHGQGPQSKKR